MLHLRHSHHAQVCPPDTDWLVVTNGDNEYGAGFFQAVADMGRPGHTADIVAFDFYSRFQRITAPACARFYAWEGSPACKRNRLRWCHTDLGANVMNYQRFVTERRRFGGLQEAAGEGVSADHFDGVMASELFRGGWRAKVLEDVCLFNHEPSFHSCTWRGGVWDDRDVVSWSVAGGRCITPTEADQILATDLNAEEVIIVPSTDNRTEGEGLPLETAAAQSRLLVRDMIGVCCGLVVAVSCWTMRRSHCFRLRSHAMQLLRAWVRGHTMLAA